jgi:hypothetical protein
MLQWWMRTCSASSVKSQKIVWKQCILETIFLFWWVLLPDVVPRGTKRNLCLRSSKLLAVIVCSWKECTAPLLITQECNSVSLALASVFWKAYCKQNSDSCHEKGILCSHEDMLYLYLAVICVLVEEWIQIRTNLCCLLLHIMSLSQSIRLGFFSNYNIYCLLYIKIMYCAFWVKRGIKFGIEGLY